MAAIGSRDVKLLDYNSARHIANKMAGEVVDVIGDTEFCGKQMMINYLKPWIVFHTLCLQTSDRPAVRILVAAFS